MSARIGAIVMAALLVLYIVFVGQYALILMSTQEPVAKGIGIALAVLPVIAVWLLVSEIVFVLRGERLVRILGDEGGLPVDDLPRLPSGRIDPVQADLQFPVYRDEVENAPESWRSWLRLGLAYDASGDRGRARWATRRAIALERSARSRD